MNVLTRHVPSEPVSIGAASQAIISECIRIWAAGAALDERERQVVDDALAMNRLDMIQAVFAEREDCHVDG